MTQVEPRPSHLLGELGFSVRAAEDDLVGTARVVPEMLVPESDHLRTSVLAVWADTLTGLLAARVMGPLVPVTLDLDVHLFRPAPRAGTIEARAYTTKAGRSVFVAAVEFAAGGDVIAVGSGSFMVAHDRTLRLPDALSIDAVLVPEPTISVPLAERAGCRRAAPGRAELPRSEDGLNSSNTVNGGLIALAAEESVLSLTSPGVTLSSLALRYLKPVRSGPVVAVADLRSGLGRVELLDEGAGNRLAAVATARTFADNEQ